MVIGAFSKLRFSLALLYTLANMFSWQFAEFENLNLEFPAWPKYFKGCLYEI